MMVYKLFAKKDSPQSKMKILVVCLLGKRSVFNPDNFLIFCKFFTAIIALAASAEDEGSKGRLYKLIGAVNSGGHDYDHYDDSRRCNCVGAPGPPGPQGTPGIPGIPGRDGFRPGNRIENDYYDYPYSRRYNDYRPYYRDARPIRDHDYTEDRWPIPPPRRDRYYDVPLHPNTVVHQDMSTAEDSDSEKKLDEGRSHLEKRKLVSNTRNPFVTWV